MSKGKTVQEPQYPCTECGGDAFIGYGPGWDDLIKEGERLCLTCSYKRTRINIFQKSKR